MDKQSMSQAQYFEELQHIILTVPQCTIKSYLESKKLYGKDASLYYDEIEFLKQAETSIMQLKDIALYLGNKVVEVRKQHFDEIEFLEAEIIQAKEEIQEQKQKLQEYYQIYQSMEEKNIQYQKQNFELEEQCDKYLQKLTTLYQTMEAVEQQRIQSWNLTKKSAHLSMNQFNEDIDQSNTYPTLSLQNFGDHLESTEQPAISCPSCTEKQYMIESLQEEINSINSEKYSLKEQIFTTKGQIEFLKKRNAELEKNSENINILEKYSSIQKQRIKLQQKKNSLQIHYFNSTEKALSPTSSMCNTGEDEHQYSQNMNHMSMIDDLNQLKLLTMNYNMSEAALTETSRTKPRISTSVNQKTFTDMNDSMNQDMMSFSEYCETNRMLGFNNRQGFCGESVSQFVIDPQQQPTSSNQILNFATENSSLYKKNVQSENNSPMNLNGSGKRQLIFNQNDQNQNKMNPNLLSVKQNQGNSAYSFMSEKRKSDTINSGKKQKSPQQKKEFYKNTRHSIQQQQQQQNSTPQSKVPCIINITSIDEKSESFNSSTHRNDFTDDSGQKFHLSEFSHYTSQQNSQIQDKMYIDSQQHNPSVTGFSFNEIKSIRQHIKNKSDFKIQQPLMDDLKHLMGIKEQPNFNTISINSSKISQLDRGELTNRENYNEEEEEKKDLQSNQHIDHLSEGQELRSVSDVGLTQEVVHTRRNSFEEMKSDDYSANETDSVHERIEQRTDYLEENQYTSDQQNNQIEDKQQEREVEIQSKCNQNGEQIKIIDDEQEHSEQQCAIQNLLKCKIQFLPLIQRNFLMKLFQWIVFLFLIPLSCIVSKPSFLFKVNSKQ